MTKENERKTVRCDKVNGGMGFVMKEALMSEEELGEHCKMFSKVTLKPFCELGHHEHYHETETYYILSGKGMYEDNGKEIPAEKGDVFFCKDGCGHGIKNTSDTENLVFIALILRK